MTGNHMMCDYLVFVCVVTQSSAMSHVGLAGRIPAPLKHWAVS